MPLPSFAPGAARSFTRNSLYIKVIQLLFHSSAGAAFGGMGVYLERTLLKVTLVSNTKQYYILFPLPQKVGAGLLPAVAFSINPLRILGR
jgi:predicted lysophospholipase L1 biosynthesis ABC-type transport system permease subunit